MNLHTVLAHTNTYLRDLAGAGGEQGLSEEGKRCPTERWGAENKPSGKGPHTHLGRLERDLYLRDPILLPLSQLTTRGTEAHAATRPPR